jgi:hypothetical protein
VGRHSSPDDDDDLVDALVAVQAGTAAIGRHAEPNLDSADTLEPPAEPPAKPPAVGPPAEPPAVGPPVLGPHFESGTGAPTAAPQPAAARTHSSAADLTLVRHHGDVRARCLAGLLAPFVVYAAVLLAAGASAAAWALWIFAPLVLAGILVGAFLDAGHKRYPAG